MINDIFLKNYSVFKDLEVENLAKDIEVKCFLIYYIKLTKELRFINI